MIVFEILEARSELTETLRRHLREPLSSYLFVGAPGSGKLAIAVDFAAALLCQDGGCGQCETCRSVTALGHPDVLVFRRSGSNLEISEAREIVQLAQTRPQFGRFRVIIVPEMHRGVHVSSTLLKIVEEPPVTTIFLLTAEGIDRALEPLASRCVRIAVPRPERATVQHSLERRSVDSAIIDEVLRYAPHRLDRAMMIAEDPELLRYASTWSGLLGRRSEDPRALSELCAQLDPGAPPKKAKRPRRGAVQNVDEEARREESVTRRDRSDLVRMGLELLLGEALRARTTGALEASGLQVITDAVERATFALDRNVAVPLVLRELIFTIAMT